jgi:hypothetical protein
MPLTKRKQWLESSVCGTCRTSEKYNFTSRVQANDATASVRTISSTGDLQLSEQKQDQQDDDHKSESAATIISGAIERTAANTAKTTEQGNYQNDQYDRSHRHRVLRF